MTKLLLVLALCGLAGCAAPRDMTHGVLVDDWYVSNRAWSPSLYWDQVDHACKYRDGVTVFVGRKPCP